MTGYVYIIASRKGGTIYIGVTSDLGRRIPEHRSGTESAFTSRYGVQRMVWYEEHFDIRDAIQRDKSLKRWPRQWKIELIERTNPEWFELLSRRRRYALSGANIAYWWAAKTQASSSQGPTKRSDDEEKGASKWLVTYGINRRQQGGSSHNSGCHKRNIDR